jgi:hypothetical protein
MHKCTCASVTCAKVNAQMYMRKYACVTVKCANMGAQCFMCKCRQPGCLPIIEFKDRLTDLELKDRLKDPESVFLL